MRLEAVDILASPLFALAEPAQAVGEAAPAAEISPRG
jgi:hypothetical protein